MVDEPKLLHHAQIIVAVPIRDRLAPFEAAYADAFDLYLPASGGPKLHYLSLVSPVYRHTGDDLVTFGYQILDGKAQLGEGGFVHADVLPGFL